MISRRFALVWECMRRASTTKVPMRFMAARTTCSRCPCVQYRVHERWVSGGSPVLHWRGGTTERLTTSVPVVRDAVSAAQG